MESRLNKSYTRLMIDRLRREAKRIARSTGHPLHVVQKEIAFREGFSGWELLVRAAVDPLPAKTNKLLPTASGSLTPELADHVTTVCTKFIKSLSDEETYRACWSGSIWIRLDDVAKGKVNLKSFQVLGNRHDGFWSEIGQSHGLACLLNFDGLAEYFVLESDLDDDGEPKLPTHTQAKYTPRTGRLKLVQIAKESIPSDITNIECALLNQT